MQIRTINAPDPNVMLMFRHRVPPEARTWLDKNAVSSIGLIQTSIADLYYFADIALKAADVYTAEVFGSCPTHVTTLALFGETSAVSTALRAIQDGTASH